MGQPSFQASNACLYVTYGLFLVIGLFIALRFRRQPKEEFLSSNGMQKAIPLALNFIASGLGSGILFTYPEISTVAGVQGLIIYAFASSMPLLIFGYLGPIVRRKCPEGFVLTEWTKQRYGVVTEIYLSVLTLITLFLYMVSELSAMQQIVNALTGLNGLPAVVVEVVVTTVYTAVGGFKVSFFTDNLQGAMVLALIIIGVITVGTETKIDRSMIEKSGYLNASLLGWQLIYILPVAILTNDFFLSNFWIRTFASRSDRDLRIGVSIATFCTLCILVLVGSTGLLAAWSHAWPGPSNADGSIALFLLLEKLPNWVVGITLVMVVVLSTSAFDSFQSAMVSSGSNDLFRNRLPLVYIRGLVVLVCIPAIIVALKSPSVLQIFLISDLVSAAAIPTLVIGLSDTYYWWTGAEVISGGIGGILSVFIFGTVYYSGDVNKGARLLLLENGLYGHDWSAFGAFVAAPFGGLVVAVAVCVIRLGGLYALSKLRDTPFKALERPPIPPSDFMGSRLNNEEVGSEPRLEDREELGRGEVAPKDWKNLASYVRDIRHGSSNYGN